MKKTLLSLIAMLVMGVSGVWAEGATVGNTDNTSEWWSAFSDYYTIKNNIAHVTFKNYSSKANNWNNWLLVTHKSGTSRGGDGYAEYFVLRCDNYGWGDYYDGTTLVNDYNWDTFKDDMDGSDVAMDIYDLDGIIYVSAVITTAAGKTYNYSYHSTNIGTDEFSFFFTVELSHITDLTVNIEPMGINNVKAASNSSSVIKTTDGIIKNGTKYNYAGQQMK